MKRFSLSVLLLLLGAVAPMGSAVRAQPVPEASRRHPVRPPAHAAARHSAASEAFDATYYRLRIALDFEQERLSGTTRAEGLFTEPGAELRLDLLSNMAVTAVRDGAGAPLGFTHADDVLAVDLGRTVGAGEHVAVEIDYAGQPQETGFGAFDFGTVEGLPYAWTLSEPYGARAWWPSKDHPADKADSVRITVSVPEGLRVGSNGVLEHEASEGGQTHFTWVERYPIATYLVSLAAGPYAVFEQAYRRPDSLAAVLGPLTMPVLHYRYDPSGTTTLPPGWAEVVDMLPVFEHWFGPYPFAAEKYGHAEFTWGGGMEHQTMSSMGGTSVGLVAHELAHQWFGDAVTPAAWPHLWLNEGFASYAEVLYWEAMAARYPGTARAVLDFDQSQARNARGTLVVEDTLNIGNLFAASRVYSKGSAVLHMLRRVLGDEAFRAALRAYQDERRYGTATTADLQRVAEAVSGQDLAAFFRQWVTEGTGYPVYEVRYGAQVAEAGYDVAVTVRQVQTPEISNVEVFVMPVTLEVQTTAGPQRFRVHNDRREQTFTLHVDAPPADVLLDPDEDLLRAPDVVVTGAAPSPVPVALRLDAFPNPVRERLHVVFAAPANARYTLALYDLLGRRVRTLAEGTASGSAVTLAAVPGDLAAGTYVLRLTAGGVALHRLVLHAP